MELLVATGLSGTLLLMSDLWPFILSLSCCCVSPTYWMLHRRHCIKYIYIYIWLVVVQVACILMFYVLPVEVLVNDVWLCRMGHVLQCFLLHGWLPGVA